MPSVKLVSVHRRACSTSTSEHVTLSLMGQSFSRRIECTQLEWLEIGSRGVMQDAKCRYCQSRQVSSWCQCIVVHGRQRLLGMQHLVWLDRAFQDASNAHSQNGWRLVVVELCRMLLERKKQGKNRRHSDFPSGLPPEYYPNLRQLNFADRTGYGVVDLRWPSTPANVYDTYKCVSLT